jgi:hypothetical protein
LVGTLSRRLRVRRKRSGSVRPHRGAQRAERSVDYVVASLTRCIDRTLFLGKVLVGFGPRCFQTAPGETSFASGGHATSRDALFLERFRRHFSLRPSVLIDICLRSAFALSRRRRQRRDLPSPAG